MCFCAARSKLQGALIGFVGDTVGFKVLNQRFRKCRECMGTEKQMKLYVRENSLILNSLMC